jgi:hemerythrin-like domain-containing protein
MTSKTEHFRHHHTEVRALQTRIEKLLVAEAIKTDAGPVATIVRELFGKFSVHLAIEDSTLYPRMINHGDPGLRKAAQLFQREMGNLKTRFDAYRSKWPGPTAISRDHQSFIDETREILSALARRIAREDNELYDLFDGAPDHA